MDRYLASHQGRALPGARASLYLRDSNGEIGGFQIEPGDLLGDPESPAG
jgi:hypothetical protein